MGRSSNKLSLVRDETTVGYGVVNIRFDPHEDIDEQFKLVTHRKRADIDVVHDGFNGQESCIGILCSR